MPKSFILQTIFTVIMAGIQLNNKYAPPGADKHYRKPKMTRRFSLEINNLIAPHIPDYYQSVSEMRRPKYQFLKNTFSSLFFHNAYPLLVMLIYLYWDFQVQSILKKHMTRPNLFRVCNKDTESVSAGPHLIYSSDNLLLKEYFCILLSAISSFIL